MFGTGPIASAPFCGLPLTDAFVFVNEAASISDAANSFAGNAVQIGEYVSAIDTVSSLAVFKSLVSESATANDAFINSKGLFSSKILETAFAQDRTTALIDYVSKVSEFLTASDSPKGNVEFIASAVEFSSIQDYVNGVPVIAVSISESATGDDVVNVAFIGFGVSVEEMALASDEVSYITNVVCEINEAIVASDQFTAGLEYVIRVSDSVQIFAFAKGSYLWNPVDDDQTGTWQNVDDTQAGAWNPVDDSQSTNWQNVDDSQGGSWVPVDDSQSTTWVVIKKVF